MSLQAKQDILKIHVPLTVQIVLLLIDNKDPEGVHEGGEEGGESRAQILPISHLPT